MNQPSLNHRPSTYFILFDRSRDRYNAGLVVEVVRVELARLTNLMMKLAWLFFYFLEISSLRTCSSSLFCSIMLPLGKTLSCQYSHTFLSTLEKMARFSLKNFQCPSAEVKKHHFVYIEVACLEAEASSCRPALSAWSSLKPKTHCWSSYLGWTNWTNWPIHVWIDHSVLDS